MNVTFIVPTVAVPEAAPTATSIHGQPRLYRPKNSKAAHFKASIQYAFAEAYDGPPTSMPVEVRLVFIMPRPKSMIWKTKPMPRVPAAKRTGDIDNMQKAFFDSLNSLAWRDDCQIWRVDVRKEIAAGDESPHVYCSIRSTDDE